MPDGTPGNGATSPFGNGNGATQATGGASGANNFLTNPSGNGNKTGGRDFTKESRPQSMAKPEVVPCPTSVITQNGGKIVDAEPGPGSQTTGNTTQKTPFKNLKG